MSAGPAEAAELAPRWQAEGRDGFLVRIVGTRGLGPVAGGQLALADAAGTLATPFLGGAVDRHVRALAVAGPGAMLERLPIDDAAADTAGLTCAGEVDVVVQPLHTVPAPLWAELAAGRPVALATVAGTAQSSVHLANRAVHGELGDADLVDAAAREAGRLLATAGPGQAVLDVGGRTLVVQCWNPMPHVIILGANALADALGAQFTLLGWTSTVLTESEAAVERFAAGAPGDAVVVLDHDPQVATPLLAAALRAGRGYVGALGSRRTQTARRTHLTRAGLDESALARLHGPAGLDIGNRSPAETAVSIAAEVIAFRTGRSARPLQHTTGSITA